MVLRFQNFYQAGPVFAFSPAVGLVREGAVQIFYYLFFVEWNLCDVTPGQAAPELIATETTKEKYEGQDEEILGKDERLGKKESVQSSRFVPLENLRDYAPATHRMIYADLPGRTITFRRGVRLIYNVDQTVELKGVPGSRNSLHFQPRHLGSGCEFRYQWRTDWKGDSSLILRSTNTMMFPGIECK